MMVIPDPSQPECMAIDDSGRLLYGVFIGPVTGLPTADLAGMKHIGWTYGIEPCSSGSASTAAS